MDTRQPMSATDLIRLRGLGGAQPKGEPTENAGNGVEEKTIEKKPAIQNAKGETGDLNLESAAGKSFVVAGKTINIPADQLAEFLARTSHNNLGALTPQDREIVEKMQLGVEVRDGDDIESIKLGQNAIAGKINHVKKAISEKEKAIEEKKVIETPTESNVEDRNADLFNEDKYGGLGDEDDDTLPPVTPKEKTIQEFINEEAGVIVSKKEDTAVTSFKDDNTGVAEINVGEFDESSLININVTPFSAKKIVKQRKVNHDRGKRTPICALSSNIFCEMTGYSYSDLTQLNATKSDPYIDRKRQLEILFSKIVNPNIPLNFDTFLKATSLYDEEAFYFGVFKSTFGENVAIPLTCQNEECKHSFTVDTPVDDLIVSKDYITMGDKVKEIMSMKSISELNDSDVNKIKRFRLKSGHLIDICHPSLYSVLEKSIKLVSNSDLARDEKYADILDLLPFIAAIYSPMPVNPDDTRKVSDIPISELNFLKISIDENDKVKEARIKLTALCDEILTLDYASVIQISKFIMDRVNSIQNQFSLGLQNIVCPKCGQPLGTHVGDFENFIPIKIRELIFLNQLTQINEVSTK